MSPGLVCFLYPNLWWLYCCTGLGGKKQSIFCESHHPQDTPFLPILPQSPLPGTPRIIWRGFCTEPLYILYVVVRTQGYPVSGILKMFPSSDSLTIIDPPWFIGQITHVHPCSFLFQVTSSFKPLKTTTCFTELSPNAWSSTKNPRWLMVLMVKFPLFQGKSTVNPW